ncbi:hypothetical protein AB6A40_011472 [Gnathostoma spinigerum]|uniref:Carbonic anhydrase n=1 Tax=Gnathostoma spinigerum TaxID=75299 RepID=A0ABD6F3K7_9BILA
MFLPQSISVQVNVDVGTHKPEVSGGGLDQRYRLIQYHFHWAQHDHEGSEHTLGGLRYPAEMHLVHKGVDNPEKFAVVGVFLIVGNDGKALKVEENVLPKITEPC